MAFWLLVSLVIALVALRRALRTEQVLSDQRRELVELRRMVQTLADRLGERWPGTGPVASADAVSAGDDAEPTAAAGDAAPRVGVPGVGTPGVAALGRAAGVAGSGLALPEGAEQAGAVAGGAGSRAAESGAAGSGVGRSGIGESGVPAPAVAARGATADAIESRIGGRWLLYIGIAAIVLGASYFLKYAFDNEWIGEHTRVLVGMAGGIALTLLGWRFVRTGHALYGQVLCGGGIGIVYLSIFAAHRWYEIVGSPLAFTGMVATTAVAAWLADRQRSQALALLAVIVGFATPFLIGDIDDGHVTLFTYDAILVTGTLILARRRGPAMTSDGLPSGGSASAPTGRDGVWGALASAPASAGPASGPAAASTGEGLASGAVGWPALNLVSYVLTVMTIVLWADRAYRPALYKSVELFLTLFLVLFLAMLRENRRTHTPAAMLATMMLALAPVLYHFGSLVNLRPHLGPLFVYLILFSVAGIIAAGQWRAPWIRVLVFVGVAVPFMGLVDRGFSRGWLAAAWTTTLAVYAAHLVAQVDTLDEQRERIPAPEILLLHANGLWLLFCLQALIVPRALAWSAPVALAVAVWYGGLAFFARPRHREAALHLVALSSALVAIACALYFDGPSLVVALAAEGAVLVALALRSSRSWLRLWGGVLLVIALIRALSLLAEPAPIAYWPLINPRTLACAFIVAVLYVLAALHRRSEIRAASPAGLAGGEPETPSATPEAVPGGIPAAIPEPIPAISRAAPPPAPTMPPALARHALVLAANVLTLVILSAEIVTYFDRRAWVGGVERMAGAALDAELARQLTLSIVWALYAVVLIAVGIRRDYRPIRYLAMLVFAFTILKVFLIDLATLDPAYRMLSVMALGVLLLVASYLYQRLRTPPTGGLDGGSTPTSPWPESSPAATDTSDTSRDARQ